MVKTADREFDAICDAGDHSVRFSESMTSRRSFQRVAHRTAPRHGVSPGDMLEVIFLVVLLLTAGGLYISQEPFDPSLSVIETSHIFEVYRIARMPILVYIFINAPLFFKSAMQNRIISVFILISFISVVWSVSPANTIGAASNLLLIFGYTSIFVAKQGVDRTIRVVWWTLAVTVAISAVLGGIGSRYAINEGGLSGGLWRGIYETKNTFGGICGILLIITLYVKPITQTNFTLRAVIITLCVVGLIGSRSIGATAATIASILYTIIYKIQHSFGKRYFMMKILSISAAITLAIIGYSYIELFTDLFGRDLTFSGRTKLWEAVLPLTLDAPIGSGYGSSGGEDAVNMLSAAMHSHIVRAIDNAYLVLALDLGWSMVAAYVVFLLWYIVVPLKQNRAFLVGDFAISSISVYQASRAFMETGSGPYPRIGFFVFLLLLICSEQVSGPSPKNQQRQGGRFSA